MAEKFKVKKQTTPSIVGRSARIVEYNVVTTSTSTAAAETTIQDYTVPIGECLELLVSKIFPHTNTVTTKIKDQNNREWNTFITRTAIGRNCLPFYSERSSKYPPAYTLKMAEGDHLKTNFIPSTTMAGTAYVTSVVRRYKTGSGADFKNFDKYQGGMASRAHYWHDSVTTTPVTTASAWSTVHTLSVEKNEAYYIISAGVGNYQANMNLARLLIDDQIEYNQYVCNNTVTELPFKDTTEIDTGYDPTATVAVTRTSTLQEMVRFKPVIKVVKNLNKNLRLQFLDNGGTVTGCETRLVGVKRLLF